MINMETAALGYLRPQANLRRAGGPAVLARSAIAEIRSAPTQMWGGLGR